MADLWALHFSTTFLLLFCHPWFSFIHVSDGSVILNAFTDNGHDGVPRVREGCPEPGSVLSHSLEVTSVLYFTRAGGEDKEEYTRWAAESRLLEESAQALESRGVRVTIINLKTCPRFYKLPDVSPGAIHVYHSGRRFLYQGLHSSAALVSFILKVERPAVTAIESKAHKKAFDKVDTPKLVAVLQSGTPEYEEFVRAAETLHPYVSCHTVSDTQVLYEEGFPYPIGVLKHLKDEEPGTIVYYQPYSEHPAPIPGNGTAKEILQFMRNHQLSFIQRLYPHDLYATLHLYEASERLVFAFLLPRTPEGLTIYKVLKRIASTENVGELNVNILYVNLEDFTMHVGALEKHFHVSLAKPVIGLVNLTTGEAQWFGKPDLHLVSKEEQTKEVQDWLTHVSNGVIRVDGLPPKEPVQEKEKEVEDSSHREDGDFNPKSDSNDKEENGKNEVHNESDQEEEATTPEKEEVQRDEEKKGEEKPITKEGHKGKRSAYMRKFDEGDKVLTELFSFVSSPFKAIFGNSDKPEVEHENVGSKDDMVEHKSTVEEPKHEKVVKKQKIQEKPKVQKVKQQTNVHKKQSAKPVQVTKTVNEPAEVPQIKKHEEHHLEDEPKTNTETEDKPSLKKKAPQDKHTKLPGKLDSAYMRQFSAVESDKLMTNLFRLTLSPFVWLMTPTEVDRVAIEKEKEILHASRNMDSTYLKQFAATEDDKVLSNTFRFLWRIVRYPYILVFGDSSQPPSTKHKEVRCEMFDATEDDKMFKRLFNFISKPIFGIIDLVKNQPKMKEDDHDHEHHKHKDDKHKEKQDKKKDQKEKEKAEEKQNVHKIKIETKEKIKPRVEKAQEEAKKEIKETKEEKKTQPKVEKAQKEAKKEIKETKVEKKTQPKVPEMKAQTHHKKVQKVKVQLKVKSQKVKKEVAKQPKDKPDTPSTVKDAVKQATPFDYHKKDSDYMKKFNAEPEDKILSQIYKSTIGKLIHSLDSREKTKEEDTKDIPKTEEKEMVKSPVDQKQPNKVKKAKTQKIDKVKADPNKSTKKKKVEFEKEKDSETTLPSHGRKLDSKYMRKFNAHEEDKVFSHIYKSTLGRLVGLSGSDDSGNGKEDKAEDTQKKEEEGNEKDDKVKQHEDKEEEGDEKEKTEQLKEKKTKKDSVYMKKFNAKQGDKIFVSIYKATIGRFIPGSSDNSDDHDDDDHDDDDNDDDQEKDDGKKNVTDEEVEELSDDDEDDAVMTHPLGSKDSEYMKQFNAEPHDKIFSHLFKSTIGRLFLGADASPMKKDHGDDDSGKGSKKEAKKERKYKKRVPVPDFKERLKKAPGHHKKITPDMWAIKEENKIFKSTLRFILRGLTGGYYGRGATAMETKPEDGDRFDSPSDSELNIVKRDVEEESQDKGEALNTIFNEESYGSWSSEDDSTEKDFLADAFKEEQGDVEIIDLDDQDNSDDDDDDSNDNDHETIDNVSKENEEEGDNEMVNEYATSDEDTFDDAINEDESSDDFIDGVTDESSEEFNEEETNENNQESIHILLKEGEEEEASQSDEQDSLSPEDFISDAFQNPETQEGDNLDDEGIDDETKIEESTKTDPSSKSDDVDQGDDEDTMSQSDFFNDAFVFDEAESKVDVDGEKTEQDPSEANDDEETDDQDVIKDPNEDIAQDDEHDSWTQSDFLHDAFSSEAENKEDIDGERTEEDHSDTNDDEEQDDKGVGNVSNEEADDLVQDDEQDSWTQSDFLNDALSSESENKEDVDGEQTEPEPSDANEVDEQDDGEASKEEDNAVQGEEQDSWLQSDFFKDVFSSEESEDSSEELYVDEGDETEEQSNDDNEYKIEDEEEDEEGEEDERQNKESSEKLDAMSTEDFINLAFTDEDEYADYLPGDEDDETDYLEKQANYRPFSDDPRKQFQYDEDNDDNDDDQIDDQRNARQHS